MTRVTDEPIGPYCALHGDEAVIYYDWVYPIMYSLGAFLMIPLIFMYLKSYMNKSLKIRKLPFSITLFYFGVQFTAYVLIAVWARYQCHSLRISTPIHIAGLTFYTSQTLLLMGLLFYRLYRTYRPVPSLRLSKCTIIVFSTYYIVTCGIYYIGNWYYVSNPTEDGTRYYSISSTFTICLAVILFGVYIFKMYSIYAKTKDQDLINLIAKNSLLAIISILVTLINMASWAPIQQIDSPHYNVFVDFLIVSDIYTNALCIFLSYKVFDGYYYKVCGFCDKKCIKKCVQARKDSEDLRVGMERHIGVDTVSKNSIPDTPKFTSDTEMTNNNNEDNNGTTTTKYMNLDNVPLALLHSQLQHKTFGQPLIRGRK